MLGSSDRTILKTALAETRSIFWAAGFFSLFINLLMLVGPLYMLQIYDRVLTSGSVPTLVYLTVAAVGLLLVSSALEFLRSRILVRLNGGLEQRLTQSLFSGLFRIPAEGETGNTQPLKDMETVRSFLTGPGLITFFDAPWAPIFLVAIFALHPILGLISLAGAVLLFGLAIASEFMTRSLLVKASQHSGAAMAFADNAIRNREVIEAMGMLQGLQGRWYQRYASGQAAQASASDRSGLLTAIAKFIRPLLQVAMLGAGAMLVLNLEITAGVMIASSIIMGRALAPVQGAINSWRNFVLARAAYRRLEEFFVETEATKTQSSLPKPQGSIWVDRVVAAAPGSTTPVIKGISFAVSPGECLGIIGPSAAGKSTLARVLVGVWKASSGHVRLDGADIAKWDNLELGPHLGYLPQDVELFEGSVSENIARFGESDPQAVIEAAKKAGVHELILQLDKGYDTNIGPGGRVLSGGQRQRIGLARALYGNPSYLVLDEPNSNLDSEGEEALRRALLELKQRGATSIVIAHRPSVLSVVEKLLVLKDGKIEHFGPKEEVIPKVTRSVSGNTQKPAQVAAAHAGA